MGALGCGIKLRKPFRPKMQKATPMRIRATAGKIRRRGLTPVLGPLDWDTWSALIIRVGLLCHHVSPIRRMAQGVQDSFSFARRGCPSRSTLLGFYGGGIADCVRCGTFRSTREAVAK